MKDTHKRLMAGVLAGTMLLSFAGCGVVSGKKSKKAKLENDTKAEAAFDYDEVKDTDYDEEQYSGDYNKYAFNIMSVTASEEGEDTNIMISPASVMFAMDLCAAGANGDTLEQINGLFTESGDPLEQQAFASGMMDKINGADKINFNCANAIWNNTDIVGDKISQDYVDYVEDTFEAEITATKFTDKTAGEINDWVEEQTDGMIEDLLEELPPETAMVLVNAIAFEGEWAEAYEDYQVDENGKFTASSGDTQDVTMLYSTEAFYFETDKATGFMKYYEGDDYAFIAILPEDESISANEFVQEFTGEDYIEFINSKTSEYDVYTMLPEFENDYKASLVNILAEMGVEDAFIEGTADFTGISSKNMLYISEVIHQTHIELDRNGTKAAAATAVLMEDAACEMPAEVQSVEVYCDRPFAYAIVDVETMNPIFVGTVNSFE
ncbi:MAG: serpin family protein [Saccharofermentans sp.]|nr:serpin family protein [Saccharofermentans sp.]